MADISHRTRSISAILTFQQSYLKEINNLYSYQIFCCFVRCFFTMIAHVSAFTIINGTIEKVLFGQFNPNVVGLVRPCYYYYFLSNIQIVAPTNWTINGLLTSIVETKRLRSKLEIN